MNKQYLSLVLCFVVLAFFATQAFASKENLLFIFDASGSMQNKKEGKIKIEIAQEVLINRVQKLDEDSINAGLIAYGHREKGNCEDIEELVRLKPLDKKEFIAKIKSIRPKGKTPIAASIKMAVDKLRTLEEKATIILISDGEETCDPDPC